jgi:hypothetical protein
VELLYSNSKKLNPDLDILKQAKAIRAALKTFFEQPASPFFHRSL